MVGYVPTGKQPRIQEIGRLSLKRTSDLQSSPFTREGCSDSGAVFRGVPAGLWRHPALLFFSYVRWGFRGK